MSLLFSLLVGNQGSEVERIIAEELTASKATEKGKEAVQKIVRRSLARVGSDTNRLLRSAFTRKNPMGLKELYRHPITGVVVAKQAKRYRPTQDGQRVSSKAKRTYPIGQGFYKAMNYHIVFEDRGKQEVFIGAQSPQGSDIYENPAYRPKRKPLILSAQWQERFRNWQRAGSMSDAQHGPYAGQSMKNYLKAIGAPTNAMGVRRPERPVLDLVQKRVDPAAAFRKALRERLSK